MTLEHLGSSPCYWLALCLQRVARNGSVHLLCGLGGRGRELSAGLSSAALTTGINAAAPACVEAYAILMFFTSLGKFNPQFFDPRKSAATVHVMGAIDNLTAGTRTATALRRLVDAAGVNAMDRLFLLAAAAGAAVEDEVAVCALIYLGFPRLWGVSAFLVHGFFSLTAFDFSVAVSGVMPLFGSQRAGAGAAWLGWTTRRSTRWMLICILLHLVLHVGAPKGHAASTEAHSAKLSQLHRACQVWFALSCPPAYVHAIPPGSMLLGLGSGARGVAYLEALTALGPCGYGAVVVASCITCGLIVPIFTAGPTHAPYSI
jgi:hypothetical protein